MLQNKLVTVQRRIPKLATMKKDLFATVLNEKLKKRSYFVYFKKNNNSNNNNLNNNNNNNNNTVQITVEHAQKADLLGTARILRLVLGC